MLGVDFGTIPPGFPVLSEGRVGPISPGGLTAAVFRVQHETVLVDLVTGTARGVSSISGEFQSLVWSTDSRYLFSITGSRGEWAAQPYGAAR